MARGALAGVNYRGKHTYGGTNRDKKSIWKSYRFPIILVIGIVVGALLGVTLGEKATVLKPLGDIFLNLMFTIVVPMVFVSITCLLYTSPSPRD